MSQIVFGQKDPQAESILKQAADKGMAYKTLSFEFEFSVENVQDKSEEKYSGELWVKGDKFKMSIDNTITFCDGKSRWVFLPEVEEVNVSFVDKEEDLDPEERFLVEPLSLFTLYKKGFKYSISGDQKIEDKTYSVIDLSPEDIGKPFFKIKCWISDEYDYYAVKYFQKDGTRITLQIKTLTVNNKLKDSLFSFNSNDYPNVEVIDLRE